MAAAVLRLEAARRELVAARAALAVASVVGKPPPRGHAAYAALAEQRERLLRMPGVLGVGLGLGAGRAPELAVFVRSRAGADALRAELSGASRALTARVGVQIVPFEGIDAAPDAAPGAAQGDRSLDGEVTQLSPGDGVGQIDPATRGTLGVFALTAAQETVGITAMHLVAASEIGAGDAAVPLVRRSSLDDAGAQIGEIDRGTRTGVDAARVRLTAGTAPSWDIPTIGQVRGWRWPAFPADIGEGVRVYGARSGHLDGEITQLDVDFPNDSLQGTLVVSIATQPGDSGAALIDSSGYVLGFLVGASRVLDGSLRVFSPAGLVLERLGCNIP